jgi:hypothetical protein
MRRTVLIAVLLLAGLPAVAGALPPTPPNSARTLVAIGHLKIAVPLSMQGYSRARFPHWISEGGGLRYARPVLIRDGRNVRVGSQYRISRAHGAASTTA